MKINYRCSTPYAVGRLDTGFIHTTLGVEYQSGDIYIYPGLVKHMIKKGHEEEWKQYRHLIPTIIEKPDYLGLNPKEQSVEYYKDGFYLLLAVKWDTDRQYYYVSTFYKLNNGEQKIKKRLQHGRIVRPF